MSWDEQISAEKRLASSISPHVAPEELMTLLGSFTSPAHKRQELEGAAGVPVHPQYAARLVPNASSLQASIPTNASTGASVPQVVPGDTKFVGLLGLDMAPPLAPQTVHSEAPSQQPRAIPASSASHSSSIANASRASAHVGRFSLDSSVINRECTILSGKKFLPLQKLGHVGLASQQLVGAPTELRISSHVCEVVDACSTEIVASKHELELTSPSVSSHRLQYSGIASLQQNSPNSRWSSEHAEDSPENAASLDTYTAKSRQVRPVLGRARSGFGISLVPQMGQPTGGGSLQQKGTDVSRNKSSQVSGFVCSSEAKNASTAHV